MDIWHVKCTKCGYEKKLNLGATDLDQTFSDLNEDYAFYKLFLCRKEKEFVTGNVLNGHFDNRCPKDGSELVTLDSIPKRCPKCDGDLVFERIDLNELIGE
jgi:hypothetical protein